MNNTLVYIVFVFLILILFLTYNTLVCSKPIIVRKLLSDWTLNLNAITDYSVLKKKSFVELIDKDFCFILIQSKSKEWIMNNNLCRNHLTPWLYYNNDVPVLNELIDYTSKINHNLKYIEYFQYNYNKVNIGRLHSDSIINKSKKIKHTLLKHQGYINIDLTKAWLVILLEIIKLNKQTKSFPCLYSYINEPEKQITEMRNYYNDKLTDEEIKAFFLDTFLIADSSDIKQKLKYKKKRQFEIDFEKEGSKIKDIIFENNKQLYNYLLQNCEGYTNMELIKQKELLIRLYCEVFEIESVYQMFQYLNNNNYIKKIVINNKSLYICTFDGDGLYFIPDKKITETTITEINSYVANNMGINMQFAVKPFKYEDIYLDLLHEFNNTH